MYDKYLLNYLLTSLLTPWSRVLFEKLTGSQLDKKFPAFCGTRRFITAFKSARHLSLSLASSIQSMPPHPTSWISSLILSSIYSWVFQVVPFSQFPTPNPCIRLSSPRTCYMPTHLILLDLITRKILGEEYRSLSSSLCSFFYSLVTSYFSGPNILLNTLFSNTLSLRSSLNVRDQVSHPYKTTGKIIITYIFIFKFLDSNLENKIFCTEWQQAFTDFSLLLLSSWM